MRTSARPLAVVLLLAAAVARADPPAAPDTADDEKLLAEAGVKADGPALVEYLRDRVPAEVSAETLTELVKRLGDDEFEVREKASAGLRALGLRALPALRRAAASNDPEVRRRAEDCIEDYCAATVRAMAAARTGAAARVLAARKPAGAAEALVRYLPFAEDEVAAEEIMGALVAVGAPGGKVDAAVRNALTDREPERRAAAALLLGRHGNAEQKAAVRKLLRDGDPAIRFRAAQGLLAGREKAAVPPLLALLGEAPIEVARRAEELLLRAAGDKAPAAGLGETKEQRAKCREAWQAWWKEREATIDLAKLDVDLQVVNPNVVARETVRRMMGAWFLGDVAVAKQLTEDRFAIGGVEEFNTRAKVDQFLEEVQGRLKQKKPGLTYKEVVTVDEYLRTKGGGLAPTWDQAKLRKADLRLVYMDLAYEGRTESFAVYVRVTGRPRVLGLDPIEDRKRK